MRKLLLTLALLFCAIPLQARTKVQGWCEQGGQTVTVSGVTSVTKFQRTYATCTLTVYVAGTTTLATLYSDQSGTPLANPFTNQNTSTGQWFAYIDILQIDVQFAATGLTTYTITNFIYNPSAYVTGFGAKCDGTTNDAAALTRASAALNGNGGTIVIPGGLTCIIGSNVTTGTKVNLTFEGGGVLSVSTGQTLTINGGLPAAATVQLFAGLGTVTLSSSIQVPVVYAEWFGALGDNSTEDTTALNAALTSMPSGGVLRGVPGRIYVSKALFPKSRTTVDLNGSTYKVLPAGTNNYLFGFGNTAGTTTNLTTATAFATSVTVASTSGFAANDRILVSAGTFTGSGTEEGPLEFNTVSSVTDGTHLALVQPLKYSYSAFGLAGAAPRVIKLTQYTNVRVTNGRIIPDPTFNSIFFSVALVENLEIDHIMMDGGVGEGVLGGNRTGWLNFHDNFVSGNALDTTNGGTAINVGDLVESKIINNVFNIANETSAAVRQYNHIVLEVTCRDNIVSGNIFSPVSSPTSGAIEISINGFNNIITNNRIMGTATASSLGIRTLQNQALVAFDGNVIANNLITDIQIDIGDEQAGTNISGNVLSATTSNASQRGIFRSNTYGTDALVLNTFYNISNPLYTGNGFPWTGGISFSGTQAANARGQATLSAGTATVTFLRAEPDATFYLMFSSDTTGETFKWSSKATTGFTITSSNGSSTAKVDWFLVR